MSGTDTWYLLTVYFLSPSQTVRNRRFNRSLVASSDEEATEKAPQEVVACFSDNRSIIPHEGDEMLPVVWALYKGASRELVSTERTKTKRE